MVFISLLILSTLSIAGSAAFFSVYGLAHTFSGTFWSVVIMGGSLEAGKLIGASYLYRYWDRTHFFLKSYLIAGITTLMLLTSVGIFGYLSAGYQTDALPLKQTKEQISLLEEERGRAIDRKRQIDDQISKGPVVSSVQKKDGELDPNAARTLREATRARESMNKQFTVEQKTLTTRIAELDKELLTLKQQLITTEAKIGPISYIAGVFDLPPDNATKYLIFLIIFAFDPMALALTLAVNIALRDREKESTKPSQQHVPAITKAILEQEPARPEDMKPVGIPSTPEEKPLMVASAPEGNWNWKLSPVVSTPEEPAPEVVPEETSGFDDAEMIEKPVPPPDRFIKEGEVVKPLRPSTTIFSDQRVSLTPQQAEKMNNTSIKELVQHFKSLKAKAQPVPQDFAEMQEIERIFERRGLLNYLQ